MNVSGDDLDLGAVWMLLLIDAVFVAAKLAGIEPLASAGWTEVVLIPFLGGFGLYAVLWVIIALLAANWGWWK